MKEKKIKLIGNMKHYTIQEMEALATSMNLTVSAKVGEPITKRCVNCGNIVSKRYYTQCGNCHLTR